MQENQIILRLRVDEHSPLQKVLRSTLADK